MNRPDARHHLEPVDAAELAELLQFLDDWLSDDHDNIDASLARFIGNHAYSLPQLRADLRRFRLLLNATSGTKQHATTT